VFVVIGPLLVFLPSLAQLKRDAMIDYGAFAQRYVREFDQKWLRGGATREEPLLGSADIQSLADLGNSFEIIKRMRVVPFSARTLVQLAVVTLIPILPLALTMISAEDLFKRLLKVVF
jgi:hypothetical protein